MMGRYYLQSLSCIEFSRNNYQFISKPTTYGNFSFHSFHTSFNFMPINVNIIEINLWF